MAKRSKRYANFRGHRYTEDQFKPYVAAIGRFSLAWNSLHEEFAGLFCQLMGGDECVVRTLAIWNSANFDRARRGMLRAAIEFAHISHELTPKEQESLRWLLNTTDEFEDSRNDVIHSPMLLYGEESALVR